MSKQQAWILIVIVAVAMGAIVQMNRYVYIETTLGGQGADYIIRIDRLTGQQCVAFVPLVFRDAPQDFLELVEMPGC